MKKAFLIIFISLITISCSNNDANSSDIPKNGGAIFPIWSETNGTSIKPIMFTYTDPNCKDDGNPETTCTDIIWFIDSSTVDALIGGGDIIFRTSYQLNKDKIKFDQVGGLNFNISFTILNDTTLRRVEDGRIWLRSK